MVPKSTKKSKNTLQFASLMRVKEKVDQLGTGFLTIRPLQSPCAGITDYRAVDENSQTKETERRDEKAVVGRESKPCSVFAARLLYYA